VTSSRVPLQGMIPNTALSLICTSATLMVICYSMLRNGICEKKDCRFTHDPAALDAENVRMIAELQRRSGSYRRSVTQRPSQPRTPPVRTPQGRPTSVEDLALLLVDMEENSVHSQQLLDDELNALVSELAVSNYAAITPEVHSSNVVYRSGVLVLPSEEVPIPETLFDTGAANGNYMSESFLNRHIEQLAAFLSPATQSVRVGTKGLIVHTLHTLTVTVAFLDSRGIKYIAQIPFGIIRNLAKDVIVGLPAICEHFGVLMLEMLETGIELYAAGSEAATNNLSHIIAFMMSETDEMLDSPTLYQIQPYYNFVHTDAELILQRDRWDAELQQQRVQLRDVLFDTGLANVNLMRRGLVDDYDFQLDPFVSMVHGHGLLQVGVEQQLVEVQSCANLVISFTTATGEQIMASLVFAVVEGLAYDVIIGLPFMLQHFGPLVLEMAADAIDSPLPDLVGDEEMQHGLDLWPGSEEYDNPAEPVLDSTQEVVTTVMMQPATRTQPTRVTSVGIADTADDPFTLSVIEYDAQHSGMAVRYAQHDASGAETSSEYWTSAMFEETSETSGDTPDTSVLGDNTGDFYHQHNTGNTNPPTHMALATDPETRTPHNIGYSGAAVEYDELAVAAQLPDDAVLVNVAEAEPEEAEFFCMLANAHEETVEATRPPPFRDRNEPAAEDLVYPWTVTLDVMAPEEADTPMPCSFPDALYYLSISHSEAVQQFHEQMADHICPAFAAGTSVVELLKSKGVRAFVPENWDGINGVEPLELNWKDTLPDKIKPPHRHINPRLWKPAKVEFDRMCTYMYENSTSFIASPLVIAPKPTPPFLRICGDYVRINKHILQPHFPIPNVKQCLDRVAQYSVFLDIDFTNSFYQIRLGPVTSARLSVQTPWGQHQPKFLPEGVSPASSTLQSIVAEVFADFEHFSIAIFDNLLVMAHSYSEAYQRLEQILDRCIERNITLKFAKTWLGSDVVTFFGYEVREGSYQIGDARKGAVEKMLLPDSRKKLQSFLGSTIYFSTFIPNFSSLCAPLHDMVKQNFVWSSRCWTPELLEAFTKLKGALQNTVSIFYPNYEWVWILQTDACDSGVGAVLYQVPPALADGTQPPKQPIGIASQKLSESASRSWSPIQKEYFGLYFGVFHFSFYLRAKPFILETDHNNLLWIEQSQVPMIIRWRIALQSYVFLLRHISGKCNAVADYWSRQFCPPDQQQLPINNHDKLDATEQALAYLLECYAGESMDAELLQMNLDNAVSQAATDAPPLPPITTAEEKLGKVHGSEMPHSGARRTWLDLNEFFPGHSIPYRVVQDFVATCPVCQKVRHGMSDRLQPLYRPLLPDHLQKAVGVDTLTLVRDRNGNEYVNVITVHASKLTSLHPSKDKGAIAQATALFEFFSRYGVYCEIFSDLGSDLTSKVVEQLTRWYGIRHRFSLVDRNESCGVEGTNAKVLRLLRTMLCDNNIKDRWSDPTVIGMVQYVANSYKNWETNVSPFHATFKTEAHTYQQVPSTTNPAGDVDKFVKLLDKDLKYIWGIAQEFNKQLQLRRTTEVTAVTQNRYQPGDFILFQRATTQPLPDKLTLKFSGPYEVISQSNNDITAQHLNDGKISIFHVDRCKLFYGSLAVAQRMARLDQLQYSGDTFLFYRGEPLKRTTIEFYMRQTDGTTGWIPWSLELSRTSLFKAFAESHPPLFPLLFKTSAAKAFIDQLNKTNITSITLGDTVYFDARWKFSETYRLLQLPQQDERTYVFAARYENWQGGHIRRRAKIRIILTQETHIVDHYFVDKYGHFKTPADHPTEVIVVDKAFAIRYPQVLPEDTRQGLLQAFRAQLGV
jgi:hypothetical protein